MPEKATIEKTTATKAAGETGGTGNGGGANGRLVSVAEALDSDASVAAFVEGLLGEQPKKAGEGEAGKTVPAEPEPAEDEEAEAEAADTTDGAEEEATEETESTEEAEDDGAPEGLSPKAQAAFDKRIGKEVAKRKALEDEIEALKAKLEQRPADEGTGKAEAKTERIAPSGPYEVEADAEVKGLRQEVETLETQLAWCEEHPEGGEVPDGKGGTISLDAAQVAKAARAMQRRLASREAALAARTELQQQEARAQEQRFSAEAERVFPWLKDQRSAEYAQTQQVLAMLPELRRRPHWKAIAATIVEGMKALEAKAKAAPAARRPAAAPAKQPTAPAVGAPTRNGKTSREEAARQAYLKNPDDEKALEAHVAALVG